MNKSTEKLVYFVPLNTQLFNFLANFIYFGY